MKYFTILLAVLFLSSAANSESKNEISLTGVVSIITLGKGTFSEYSYFLLKTDEEEVILYNRKNYSVGFDDYINKEVELSGFESLGYIGWNKQKIKGVVVNSIKLLDN